MASSSSSSGGSKKRDASAMAAPPKVSSSNPTFLADVIRSAELSEATVEKRTKFIKSHLDEMSEEQLTRFEFFIRSHLTRSKVRIKKMSPCSLFVFPSDQSLSLHHPPLGERDLDRLYT